MNNFKHGDKISNLKVLIEFLQIDPKQFEILTDTDLEGNLVNTVIPVKTLYGITSNLSDQLPILKIGDEGKFVLLLQRLLNELGSDPLLELDGIFGTKTANAVRKFRSNNGLSSTSTVQLETWNKIVQLKPDLWKYYVTNINELLSILDIKFESLVELTKSKFLNKDQNTANSLSLFSFDPSICNLDKSFIIPKNSTIISDTKLRKINKFVRLSKIIKTDIKTLDKILVALNSETITSETLMNISIIKLLHQEFNHVSYPKILSLWNNIDTHGDDSLFLELFFRSNLIPKPKEPGADFSEFNIFILNDSNSELKTNFNLIDQKEKILTSLRLAEEDFKFILDDLNVDVTSLKLTLTNLSILYRYVTLSTILKIKISELIKVKSLTTINPFENPQSTFDFIQFYKSISNLPMNLDQICYLFKHISDKNIAKKKIETSVDLLKNIREKIFTFEQIDYQNKDDLFNFVLNNLYTVFEKFYVDKLVNIINKTDKYSSNIDKNLDIEFPENFKTKISYDRINGLLNFKGSMQISEKDELLLISTNSSYQSAIDDIFNRPRDLIKDGFDPIVDHNQIISVLIDSNKPNETINTRYEFIFTKILPSFKDIAITNIIKTTLAESLNLSDDIIDILVDEIIKSFLDPSKSISSDFDIFSQKGLSANYFPSINFTGSVQKKNSIQN